MALADQVDSDPQLLGRTLARIRRRVLRWRTLPFIALASVPIALLSWPVARISPETASLITPGMTAEQAQRHRRRSTWLVRWRGRHFDE